MLRIEKLETALGDVSDTLGRGVVMGFHNTLEPSRIEGRKDFNTNISAYSEFIERKDEVFGLMQFLRSGFDDMVFNAEQVRNLASGIVSLPAYLAHRKDLPVPEKAIPSVFIDAYRAAAGVLGSLESLIATGDIVPTQYLSAEGIYSLANAGNEIGLNYFIGQGFNAQACPAPEGLVRKVLGFMIEKLDNEDVISRQSGDWQSYIKREEVGSIVSFGEYYCKFRDLMEERKDSESMSEERRRETAASLAFSYGKIGLALGFTQDEIMRSLLGQIN